MAEPIYSGTEAELREILGGIAGEERASKWVGTSKIFLTGATAVLLGACIAFGITPEPNAEVSGSIISGIGALVALFRIVSPMIKVRF